MKSSAVDEVPPLPRSAGFQPAVSQASILRAARTVPRFREFVRPANWKSAIQQIGNLRYDFAHRRAVKSALSYMRLAVGAVTAVVLTGCLFKSATVPARHFLLAPISTNEPPSASTEQLSIGIGFVKMPAYLLRDSLAVRTGASEIDYLEGALWGERLDQCFQRTLAANLSRLLSSDNVYSTDWGRNQVQLRVSIDVQQFDVDTRGRGTLIAYWRITAPESDTVVKRGTARLDQAGAAPRGNPEVITTTLSELEAAFSHDLAQSIRESVKKSQ